MRQFYLIILAALILACEKDEDVKDFSDLNDNYRGQSHYRLYESFTDSSGKDTMRLALDTTYFADSARVSEAMENQLNFYYHRLGKTHPLQRNNVNALSGTFRGDSGSVDQYTYDLQINVDSLVGEIRVEYSGAQYEVYEIGMVQPGG